jgi:hypothetical protein
MVYMLPKHLKKLDFQKDEQALHIKLKIELHELSEIPAVISCASEE